jgi:DNA-binding transcriptional LysR family regulator
MLNDKSVDFLSDNLDCAIRVGGSRSGDRFRAAGGSAALRGGIAGAAGSVCTVKTPEDLCAAVDCDQHLYQRHVELFDDVSELPARVVITPRLSTDSLHVARNTVLSGLGVAVVSSWTVKEDIREGRLVHLLPSGNLRRYRCIWFIPGRAIIRRACGVSGDDAPGHAGGRRDEKARAAAIKKPTRRSAFLI